MGGGIKDAEWKMRGEVDWQGELCSLNGVFHPLYSGFNILALRPGELFASSWSLDAEGGGDKPHHFAE